MPEILKDFSQQALIKAIENNAYALTPFSHNWERAEVYTGTDMCWCLTDISFPMCNSAFHIRLKPEQVDDTIESFKAKGNRRKVAVQWYIGHDTQPANLGEKLATHGFTTYGASMGMAIDLKEMKEDVPFPSGLQIIEVKDVKTLKKWCHVTCVGFGIPEPAEPSLLEWFKTDIEYNQPIKFYLGLLKGKPVATSMYFLGEGVVGIYFVATLPPARHRGIGFAVTQKPLLEGREMGYRIGILQASKMGEPVYRQMGFKEYCKVQSYSWLPKTE
jgi:predicted GNAT family acetyltransferase